MGYNPLETFLQEAEELIADVEQSALALQSQDAPGETVHRLFRAFHTIKGSGAMCGLDAVTGFTHHVESLLDKVREGALAVSPELTNLILQAADHIKLLLDASQGGPSVEAASTAALVAAINEFVGTEPAPAEEHADSAAHPEPEAPARTERTWSIRFRPNPSLLANGGNPASLLRDLRDLGSCDVIAHADEVPLLDEMESDRCYFWWTITLCATCDENAIHDVFIFVEDDGNLAIEEICGAQPAGGNSAVPKPAAPDPAQTAAPQTPQGSRKSPTAEATVRVPAERLDRLVNLVGEFVMNQSCLAQAAAQTGTAEFANSIQVLEQLVAELRDNVLGIRMLPIGTLFGRFHRVVHDLSHELGKEAELVTAGAETELDKSILDQLGEPLVHCLRNCLDHGIEPAAERIEHGKLPRARILLSAEHIGSSVVISVEDDGRGIDKQAVRAKAIEKQLVSPDAALTDKEILDLILLPGFSTARQVTSVSGRGVGMDAVKRQIDLLRGSLTLETVPGKGTKVSITLPLTLAIIDGLLVQVANERFIIPMSLVAENVELSRAERSRYNGRNLLAVRGELIPYIDLRGMFSTSGNSPAIQKVVIVQQPGARVGVVVDRVLGAHQTVIQSLGKFYKKVDVVSGATIMGDGEVALILDIGAMVRRADRECQTPSAAPEETELVGAG